MKKKLIALLATSMVTMSMLVGCGSGSGEKSEKMMVGMLTDAGNIDDKSFNQGTWEGIGRAEKELGVSRKYLKPTGTIEAEYLKEIGNLYDAGYKFIVGPGFKLETAFYKAQDQYKDAKFVLIDGTPQDGNGNFLVRENSVAINFAEHEGGFVAGVATAVQLQEGELGFIGGMKFPSVQRFNWGFQQGIKYANENLGTKVSLKAENVVYQGTFDDSAAGTQLGAQMYDRGVKAIFCAAGGVGNGVISEAKTRAAKGDEVWVVGVDSDQYNDGIYADGKSVILTSAMKRVDNAAFDMIKAEQEGKFPGGQIMTLTIKEDALGLPETNPNLSEETLSKVNDVIQKIKSDEIKVSDTSEGLIEP